MTVNSKKLIPIIIVVVLTAGGAGFWFWQNKKSEIKPEEKTAVEKKPASLGAKIFERTQNPIKDRTPETNPFSTDTNPFDAKTNPFQDEYKNPFK